MKDLLIGLFLLTCPAAVFVVFGASGLDAFDDTAPVKPSIRDVEDGRIAYVKACAACHGRTAQGTARGPTLVKAGLLGQSLRHSKLREGLRGGGADGPECPGAGAMSLLSEQKLDEIEAYLIEMQRRNGRR